MEYFQGFKVKLTGKIVKFNNRNWQEFVYLEGPKAGQTGVAPTHEDAERDGKRRRQEWQDQQDGFHRLRENQK